MDIKVPGSPVTGLRQALIGAMQSYESLLLAVAEQAKDLERNPTLREDERRVIEQYKVQACENAKKVRGEYVEMGRDYRESKTVN